MVKQCGEAGLDWRVSRQLCIARDSLSPCLDDAVCSAIRCQ
jgi:hypothetical protein